MPHLIITYGPTGSGKGYLYNKFVSRLSKQHPELGDITAENSFFAEVDSYIEGSVEYKMGVWDTLKDFYTKTGTNHEMVPFLRENLQLYAYGKENVIGPDISNRMFAVYGSVKDTVKKKFLTDFKAAVAAQKHIIYELTGSSGSNPLEKFFGKDGLLGDQYENYTISIVFPFVRDDVIIDRATDRFIERVALAEPMVLGALKAFSPGGDTMKALQYLADFQKIIPPRLPDVQELRTKKIKVAQENLVQYIRDNVVENVIVYDNNFGSTIDGFNVKHLKDQEKIHRQMFADKYKEHIAPPLHDIISRSNARIIMI